MKFDENGVSLVPSTADQEPKAILRRLVVILHLSKQELESTLSQIHHLGAPGIVNK